MNRSKWKGPYVEKSLLKKIKQKSVIYNNEILIVSRNSLITPKFVGLIFKIHNGKTFLKISIFEEMVGYKLGEFVPTRKRFNFKKKKKRK
nr:ribosomal protein S19 [Paralia sulcata]